MGSPTKRTDATRATILKALRHGATYKRAAEAAGVAYETFRAWRAADPAFSAAVEKAHGQMMQTALASIEKAAKEGTWQAAAWWLERMFPDEYGRSIQEHRGEIKHTLEIVYVDDWRERPQVDAAAVMIESYSANEPGGPNEPGADDADTE